jgi:hypothetical protein
VGTSPTFLRKELITDPGPAQEHAATHAKAPAIAVIPFFVSIANLPVDFYIITKFAGAVKCIILYDKMS